MSKILTGIVGYINEETSSFSISTSNKNVYYDKTGHIWCRGDVSNISIGMPVKIQGDWNERTFEYEKIQSTWINLSSTISYIKTRLKNTDVKRDFISEVCNKYGRLLFSTEKTDLINQIKSDFPEEDEANIILLVNSLSVKDKELCDLEDMLIPYGISTEKINEMYDFYGKISSKKIKEDPYKAMSLFDIKFDKTEQIAFDMGIEPYSQARINGLIRECLNIIGRQGDTMIEPNKLAKMVSYKSRKPPYRTDIPEIFISYTVITKKEFILKNDFVSFYYLYKDEMDIAKKLLQLKNINPFTHIGNEDIERVEQSIHVSYGTDQKKAFKMLETGGVNILTGGPGTGKTTLINGIIDQILYIKSDAKIKLCAPTGRAAKRLSESTGMEAETIHKMCGIKPYISEEMTNKLDINEIEADFVICDEFSMVSADLAAMLLKAIPKGTRFIIVGDEHQLPSIDAGNVLHDLIASKIFPVYRLIENFRQNNGGNIYENGVRILNRQIPYSTQDFQIYKTKDEHDSYNALCYFMDKYYDPSNPYKTQLIEPSRKGVAGIFKMNQYMHKKITYNNKTTPEVGDKIIFENTNDKLGYVNGDVGTIEKKTNNAIHLDLEGQLLSIPKKSASDFELAYSFSIHKSQGSESQIIIIYLPTKMKHMMTNPLLYTAVTRAKSQIIIIYEDDSLEYCVNNVSGIERKTRLLTFLS